MQQCSKCLITIDKEFINSDGECIFCTFYKNKWANRDYIQNEKELITFFEKCKNRNSKYDCLVPISGGKDSIYVLYLAKKKFGLNPLAFTYDNGFRTQIADENVQNAVEILDVDHIIHSYNIEESKKLYREFFHRTGNLCTVCNHSINTTICRTTEENNIRLVLIGGVGKLEQAPIYGNRRYCMEDVFRSVINDCFSEEKLDKYCNKEIRRRYPLNTISIFNYVNYDYRTVLDTIKSELNWKEAPYGDAKVDCDFYPVLSYLKYLQNGITSSALISSALLRDGQISKEEFSKRIDKEKERLANFDPKQIDEFYEFFDIDKTNIRENGRIIDYVEPVIDKNELEKIKNLREKSEISNYELILKVMDIVRQELYRDGGDIEIVEFKNNILKIKMCGNCSGCLQVDDTMLPYIESLLHKIISDKIIVEQVQIC